MSLTPTPPLSNGTTSLRPLMQNDYDRLYHAELIVSDRFVRYRHRGTSVPVEQYVQTLWVDVLMQFVVAPSEDLGEIFGLVTCYSPDWRNQTAKLALVSAEATEQPSARGAATMEGLFLFLDFLFAVHPLRKLYLEVLEWNLPAFGSLERWGANKEAHFVAHELHGQTAVDLLVYSITRDDWYGFRDQTTDRDSTLTLSTALREITGGSGEDIQLSELDSLEFVILEDYLHETLGLSVPIDALMEMSRSELEAAIAEWGDGAGRPAGTVT